VPTDGSPEISDLVRNGSPEIRTQDQSVKSRVLYR